LHVVEATLNSKIVLSSTIVNATPLTPSEIENRAPVPIARPEIHKTVAGILDPLPRGKLLDVPAGEGALSARLSDAGFQVQACDLYPEIFMLRNINVLRGNLSGT